jgi:hypothetical protein
MTGTDPLFDPATLIRSWRGFKALRSITFHAPVASVYRDLRVESVIESAKALLYNISTSTASPRDQVREVRIEFRDGEQEVVPLVWTLVKGITWRFECQMSPDFSMDYDFRHSLNSL